MTDTPFLPTDGLAKQAALALAIGVVAAPFGGARAAPVVTVVNQSFPATISFNGGQQFSIDTSPSVTGSGTNLIETTSSNPMTAAKLAAGAVVGPSSFTSSANAANLALTAGKNAYYIGLEIQQSATQNIFGYAEIGTTPLASFAPQSSASSGSSLSSPAINVDPPPPFSNPTSLIEYAFEATPNTPITIPAGVPVPEPESLALLALGALGALAVRRRTASRDLAG